MLKNAKNKVLKVNIGSHDDKDVDTLDNLMLTYPVIKSFVVPLFTMQSVLLYAHKHLVSKYSIATDQVPVLCVHVVCFVCLSVRSD
jgi:hypothetical protein